MTLSNRRSVLQYWFALFGCATQVTEAITISQNSYNVQLEKSLIQVTVQIVITNNSISNLFVGMFSTGKGNTDPSEDLDIQRCLPTTDSSRFWRVGFGRRVQFCMYTRHNPVTPQILDANLTTFNSSYFIRNAPTKIVTHGFRHSCNSNFTIHIRDAYLRMKDVNVICVDWSSVACKWYPNAKRGVRKVAIVVKEFINFLIRAGVPPLNIHGIGHSLGAHVMGMAGFITNHPIRRITGLDPALPLYAMEKKHCLQEGSAKFVDVIHTCGRFLSIYTKVGHADFYPNGGVFRQPGCGKDYKGKCSHKRSWDYFIESILYPGSFLAIPCESWQHFKRGQCFPYCIGMGEDAPENARGAFFLRTSDVPPYGLGPLSIIGEETLPIISIPQVIFLK